MHSCSLNTILKGFEHVSTQILLTDLLRKETNDIHNLISSPNARMFYLPSDTRNGLLGTRLIYAFSK